MENTSSARPAPVLRRIAGIIVKYRYVIIAVFAVCAVYCAISLGKVRVNSELAAFLPEDSETRRAIAVMNEEFPAISAAQVMVCGVTAEDAVDISAQLGALEGVGVVSFDLNGDSYKDGDALYTLSYSGEGVAESVDRLLEGYEHYIYASLGNDYTKKLASEMFGVVGIAAAVIALVLILTSKSYFEVVVFAIVFAVAALLNMGTNHWLGEISSISNSVAVILQLALAIDYAIIFAHRYQHELTLSPDGRTALTDSLAGSIAEISSSSLTTVSGLCALMLMQFGLGKDLGVVLAKGIICSMLTVFLLMPGLLYVFEKPIRKTSHRPFIPEIRGWGKALASKIPVFLILFALVLPAAVVFSGKTEYSFSDKTVTEIIPSENRTAMRKINSVFEPGSSIALLVPAGDNAEEKALVADIASLDGVRSVLGLAAIEVGGGRTLADSFTCAEFAALLGVDPESASLLYKGYRFENGDLSVLWDDSADRAFPLADVLGYMLKKIDRGEIVLTPEQSVLFERYRGGAAAAISQLKGSTHDRIVINTPYLPENAAGETLADKVRFAAEARYGEGKAIAAGEITTARDLRESYSSDSVLIAVLTAAFVFIILLFTFKSPVAAALLVFVIQGSIFINFSIPYFTGMRASFVTNMIVSAIQMGATIDYAIVIMNRYLAHRQSCDKKRAMMSAVSESFSTVMTSGSIMTAAGFLIAYRVSDVYVGHIGHAVGRGALISALLVLTVLPQLILLFDTAVRKTTFSFGKKKASPKSIQTGEAG